MLVAIDNLMQSAASQSVRGVNQEFRIQRLVVVKNHIDYESKFPL